MTVLPINNYLWQFGNVINTPCMVVLLLICFFFFFIPTVNLFLIWWLSVFLCFFFYWLLNKRFFFFGCWWLGICGNANNVYPVDVANRGTSEGHNIGSIYVHVPRNSWLLHAAPSASGSHLYFACSNSPL